MLGHICDLGLAQQAILSADIQDAAFSQGASSYSF